MKRYSPVLFILVLFSCAASLTFPLEAGDARPAFTGGSAACRTEVAAGVPLWFTTGAEVAGRFLVVDVNRRQLVEISRNGVADELRAAVGDFVAGKDITRIRQGTKIDKAAPPVVLEFAGGRLLEIDNSLTPRRKAGMVGTRDRKSGNIEIGRLHDWILTGDGKEVFGYGDLVIGAISENPPPAAWRNGYVRFNLGSQESFRVVEESLYPGSVRTMMLLTYSLMASIGPNVYVVYQNGNHLELRRSGPNDQGLRPMRAFPGHLLGEFAPRLPSFVTSDEYVRTMKAAEAATMPVGLYAWDDALFLLYRTYQQGQRRWYLSKIDPARDEILWEARLPGASAHMMAIPGEKEWAFLEKGPVLGRQTQITHQIRFVKSDRLKAQSMPSKSLCNL